MSLIFPLLIPFLSAALSLLAWRHARAQRWLGVIGTGGLLASAAYLIVQVTGQGTQAMQAGNWPAPFGITLVADRFSALMVLLGGITGFAVAVYSLAGIDEQRISYGYFPLLHILLMGVSAAFLAGDLFNLYVWFEVLLISSFVLLALGSQRPQLEGALKYVTLNLVSSFLFLSAVGILYGAVGTLNMADVSRKLTQLGDRELVTTLSMLFLISFGIKAAVFPLFFWLPASYHTPPAAVSAIFAGMLTKVGVYALIRVFTLLFTQNVPFTHGLIVVIAALTMATGVLGAMAQNEFRRILSFHIISQIGYMALGLGLYTRLALAGSVFYIAHHIIVKTNLFLVSGIANRLSGSYDLDRLGGLLNRAPWLALLFAIPAMSLAGIPPLSGFIAKLALVRAGLDSGEFLAVGAAVAVGLLTLYSMCKIWLAAFWKPAPEGTAPFPPPLTGLELRLWAWPVAALALLTVGIGLCAGPLFEWSLTTAEELLNPTAYCDIVLGGSP